MVDRSTLWRHANPTKWRLYAPCADCGAEAGRACTDLRKAHGPWPLQRPHPGRPKRTGF